MGICYPERAQLIAVNMMIGTGISDSSALQRLFAATGDITRNGLAMHSKA